VESQNCLIQDNLPTGRKLKREPPADEAGVPANQGQLFPQAQCSYCVHLPFYAADPHPVCLRRLSPLQTWPLLLHLQSDNADSNYRIFHSNLTYPNIAMPSKTVIPNLGYTYPWGYEPGHLRVKVKSIPLQALTGPEGSRRLRHPDFKTIGT
jgi:hypothetical protein